MTPDTLRDLRMALDTVTQTLIDAIDKIDGDPDIETADLPDDECNGDLEPSFGIGTWIECKLEYDLELDTSDAECSLGWTRNFDQSHLGMSFDDLEVDDEREPEDGI